MNDQNPYAAPQTPLVNHEPRNVDHVDTLGTPEDFLRFRVGALLLLVGSLSIGGIFWGGWLIYGGVMLLFLLGTYLLTTIPANTPGRGWFVRSCVLQLVNPVLIYRAIGHLPDPDWDRLLWQQRLGIWGELLALFFVLLGLWELATWLRFSLLRWATKTASVLLVCLSLFDAWARAQSFGYEAILYGLIFGFCGVIPFCLLLLVCWVSALLVPDYVSLPLTTPDDPHALPATIDQPETLRREGQP